ncbi:MAG: fatty acid desaturase [Thalassobaculum sp.]|uniref:fatty acid desaturase n=1 Tax=Thalassobaculum sp. TaxID=2022740 RepID=UPI0032EEFD01
MSHQREATRFDAPSAATVPVADHFSGVPGVAATAAVPMAPRLAARVEWRTVALAAGIYGGWLAAVLAGGLELVPVWAWAPLAAWCVAWQASLQHEVLHGHPTPNAALNRWIAGPPLALWLPYERYRATHLQHHVDERLTDPLDDPESFYVTADAWDRAGPLHRAMLYALNTLAGRLLLGPPWVVARFLLTEARGIRRGDRALRRAWGRHLLQAAAVVALLQGLLGLPVWLYVLAVAWPGTALMLLRSFAEHRTAGDPAHRSAIVESRGPLAWLFLSNNLHALHHERPGLPWFVLAKIYDANRDAVLTRNGGYRLDGYREVARRWLLTPRDHPRHPGWTD